MVNQQMLKHLQKEKKLWVVVLWQGDRCMSRNDYGLRFGEPKQYYGNFPDGRTAA